jgi:hypothetical protein
MNFNLVEMYNGLLRFNKHILNELAEGLKHLPNLDGVSKGDSLIINEQGNPAWGSAAFIPTFENAAYGIEWTKDDNDIIRIGNAKFHRELPIQNRLKGCVYNEKKISYFLNPTGWAKPLENGFIPPLDGSDGDVGVRIPVMDGLNTLMLKIFFIKFKVLQVLDILIGMAKELILLNIMVNTLE